MIEDQGPTWGYKVGGDAERHDAEAAALPFIPFNEVRPSIASSDFVENLLTDGSMSVLYGESNSGKTFLALDLALHVATGAAWFGRAITPGPVLYLALEGGGAIRNRIVAYRKSHDLDDAYVAFALVAQGLNLLDPEGDLAAIIATAQAVEERFEAPVRLIVVDTLSRAMPGGDENGSQDMTSLVDAGDRLRQTTGAHVLWVHHSGKDSARGARGHSSLRAATDSEIEITADGTDRRAEVRKQRDLPGGDIFRFSLHVVELGNNARGKPVSSCIVEPADEGGPERRDPARSLQGHNRRAFEVLNDTLASEGLSGFAGVPGKIPSVSDNRWREAFYAAAMPGAEPDARKKAFRRASDKLVEQKIVAISAGRVWIVSRNQPGQDNGT